MDEFKYQLNQEIRLKLSEEKGFIVGRAEYVNGTNSYLIRYKDANNCQREEWISEDALESFE